MFVNLERGNRTWGKAEGPKEQRKRKERNNSPTHSLTQTNTQKEIDAHNSLH